MKFSYRARAKDGNLQSGSIEAVSKEMALDLLAKNNLFITSLEPQVDTANFLNKLSVIKKVSKKDLVVFFRELSVMLASRVPVVQSIHSLADQASDKKFKAILSKIASMVEEGISLSEALSSRPDIFSNFYINLIKSGEASGKISESLFYIAENVEREDDISTQVRQAMIYPLFLIGILLIVVGVIVVEVMPKIAALIKDSGATPSSFTALVLGVSSFLQSFWWLVALLAVGVFFLGVYYQNTALGKRQYDHWSLSIPFMGNLFKKVFLSRFCGNVSTLLVAGISINDAIKITKETIDNNLYQEMIEDIGKSVSEGEKMSDAMMEYKNYFPLFVVQIVKVGEETGKLDKSLMEVVNFYQKEIKRNIDLFTRLLEPIMIIFLGGIVLVLAISVLSSLYGAIGSV